MEQRISIGTGRISFDENIRLLEKEFNVGDQPGR